MKPCRKCGSTDMNNGGRCRPCTKKYSKKYRIANAEKIKEYNAEYRATHTDNAREYRAAYYKIHKEKMNQSSAEWQKSNPDRVKERNIKWVRNNPEKRKEVSAEYRRKNVEKIKEYKAEYFKVNSEKWQSYHHKRRARKLQANGSFTKEDIILLMKRQKNKCIVCKRSIKTKYHVDHIMPLSLGGLNSPENLQLLCPGCNLSKGSKHPTQFMQSRGYLL